MNVPRRNLLRKVLHIIDADISPVLPSGVQRVDRDRRASYGLLRGKYLLSCSKNIQES